MGTRYPSTDSEVVESEYDNAVIGDMVNYTAVAGNVAMYEMAVSENPMYSTVDSRRDSRASDASRPRDVLYDDKTVLPPPQTRVVEAVGSSSTEEGEYIQTGGAAVHQYGALSADRLGSERTYHYVEPTELFEPPMMKQDDDESKSGRRVKPWMMGVMILMVAMGLGVVSMVMVFNGDDGGPHTGASTGASTDPSVPVGLVAPFVLEACPAGWSRLQGQEVQAIAGAASAFQSGEHTRLPDLERERRFVRPANESVDVGTLEDQGVNVEGLSTEDVSVWGPSTERITYINDPLGTEGLLFLDKQPAKLSGGDAETRPTSISLLYCVKVKD